MAEPDRFWAIKYCLFKPESPLWKTPLREELIELIRSGRESSVVYVNAREYFDLLAEGLERGIDWLQRQDIVLLLSCEAFVKSLWETVTSRSIQYRMQIKFLRARDTFLQNGASITALPLTAELSARLDEHRRISGSSANPDAAPAVPEHARPAEDRVIHP
jgi:hypothetical protein